ncbi:acetamidase/formamidase family protein [Halocatena pleomorpha]|uniref:Acetamidase n=1 Tax=Halocatena pleomorpha TaxID=1785090 RepID=A0A3P3R841_9EURY|nr:acetamidase/formamidase family protein [Halocatena pleomorpha]RRJ29534.1 acetamidase [Halocatena pleomorpha]
MSQKSVSDDHVVYEFTPDMDAERTVPPGTTLEIHTRDSVEGDVQTEEDLMRAVPDEVNAATGPVAVKGATPGDILQVTIEDIRLREEYGRVLVMPEFGLQHGYEDTDAPRTRITEIDNECLHFNELEIELDPMIGTIGVAPQNTAYSTLVPHDHGGNLDTTDISAGSTVYFPVFQPGGLLAMGDSKAAMADGEVCGTGAEIATEIDVTVDLISDPVVALDRPLIETEDAWKTVASAETMEEACELANRDLCRLLEHVHGFDFTDAYMFSSLVADLEVSQVVDPHITIRNAIPKEQLANPFTG